MAAESFTGYINKNKQKRFQFYISLERNNHPVIFNCFQMYWTKATVQKYSDQSQHEISFT